MSRIIDVDEVGEDDSDFDDLPDLIDDNDLEVLPDLIYLPPNYIPSRNPYYEELYGIRNFHDSIYFQSYLY